MAAGSLEQVGAAADPCEPNYRMSAFIAEPFNALSALGLVLAGSNAMHQSRKYNFETRFMVLGFSVVIMGASSMFFHATLSERSKSWEEMAMVWSAFGWVATLMHMSHSTNETPSIAMVAALGCGLWLSQMDLKPEFITIGSHVLLAAFGSAGVYLLHRCVNRFCNLPLFFASERDQVILNPHPSTLKLQLMARWQIGCLLLAFLSLLVPSISCSSTMGSFQPHALWHLLFGLSSHYGLQFAMALRQSILHKAPPATSWSLGGLLGCVVPTEVPSRAMGAQLRWLLKMAGVDHLDPV
uniref:Alkaline ceramidase n=1 Tax=Lotharella globosa TaxID=91324 RepID=A0A7S3YZH8_9EUKA